MFFASLLCNGDTIVILAFRVKKKIMRGRGDQTGESPLQEGLDDM